MIPERPTTGILICRRQGVPRYGCCLRRRWIQRSGVTGRAVRGGIHLAGLAIEIALTRNLVLLAQCAPPDGPDLVGSPRVRLDDAAVPQLSLRRPRVRLSRVTGRGAMPVEVCVHVGYEGAVPAPRL